jgi:hypothetical protein
LAYTATNDGETINAIWGLSPSEFYIGTLLGVYKTTDGGSNFEFIGDFNNVLRIFGRTST